MMVPRFNSTSTCPKCGAGFASARYAPRFTSMFAWEVGAVRADDTGHEAIVRTCERCGYRWEEAPLDAPSQP